MTLALGNIGRLPVPDPDMTLPILLSIESMYAELVQSTDETERYTVVRDAFPNHYHLRVALLALIRLLDPGRRSSESGLEEADADLLIRTFLFEERHVGEARCRQCQPPSWNPALRCVLRSAIFPDGQLGP